MWGDDFFCLFFEYSTVAFLSANTYILIFYFMHTYRIILKESREYRMITFVFLSLPSLPMAASRSSESQKGSILCRTIWVMGRWSSSKVPLWYSLLNCKFCSCMASQNSKFNVNNKPWLNKSNVLKNVQWLEIVNIFWILKIVLNNWALKYICFSKYFYHNDKNVSSRIMWLSSSNLCLQMMSVVPD